MYRLLQYVARFAVLLLVLPMHEFAHAFAAKMNGDDTAKMMGRYTLNPFKHFDILGLASFMLVGFGWAKPVPVNPYNYRNYKAGSIWVAVAGVIANYILAFLFYPLLVLSFRLVAGLADGSPFAIPVQLLVYICLYGVMLDLSLFAFNLIPVYPLDGFRLMDALIKRKGRGYEEYKRIGYFVLLVIILFSSICSNIPQLQFLDVFGYFMNFCVKIIGYPISLFWDWVLGTDFRFVLWKIIA